MAVGPAVCVCIGAVAVAAKSDVEKLVYSVDARSIQRAANFRFVTSFHDSIQAERQNRYGRQRSVRITG